MPFCMRMFLVSASLPEVTQHIHSFLAKGVMSSQTFFAFGEAKMAFFKSAGSLCKFSFCIG
jgi:hypothetical protein